MVVESTCGGIDADFDLEIEFAGELRFFSRKSRFHKKFKIISGEI